MEEQAQQRRQSWAQGQQRPGEIKGPFRSGYELGTEGRILGFFNVW